VDRLSAGNACAKDVEVDFDPYRSLVRLELERIEVGKKPQTAADLGASQPK